jgi:hypothetical protein
MDTWQEHTEWIIYGYISRQANQNAREQQGENTNHAPKITANFSPQKTRTGNKEAGCTRIYK